jgi:hypothetical protein
VTVRGRLEAWLGTRTARERALLAVAAVSAGVIVVALAVGTARDDLATLRTRVAAHERELGEVRRLVTTLRRQGPHDAPAAGPDAPLLGRLEEAAAETVGRDRIAAMTPAAAPAGGATDGVALRIAGATLAEVVHLLHGLASGTPPLAVTRLELRKHPDDPTRFDASLEVGR